MHKRTIKIYASPLESITKNTERENEALRMKDPNPSTKKNRNDFFMIIRKLKITRVEWLNRYAPVAMSKNAQAITIRIRIPRYSNCNSSEVAAI